MAITIDYSTFTINVPRADLTLIQSSPVEQRQLNIDAFRTELNDIMDDSEGIPFPTNHFHTGPLSISGVTLARVVEILSPYTITFEDAQYQVNIVGGNSNIADKVNPNQVGINTANSAGLQDPVALQAGAFFNEVAIKTSATQSGTTFPYGTRGVPVNNIADAIAVAEFRGIRTIRVLDDLVMGSGDFSDGYTFVGDNSTILTTLQSATNIINCTFKTMTLTGDLDGNNTLEGVSILSLNLFNGFVFQCGVSGTITLGNGSAPSVIIQSFSLLASGDSSDYPKIDIGGTQTNALVVRDWNGDLGIINCTSQNVGISTSIDMSSGRVTFEATVSAGTHGVAGVGPVVDLSSGTAVVNDVTIRKEVADNAAKNTDIWNTMGLNPAISATITDTQVNADSVVIDISNDGTTTTLNRQ